MEENMPDDNNDGSEERKENPKRLKTENRSLEKSEESSSSSNTTEQETASTSTDCDILRNYRLNYRSRLHGSSENDADLDNSNKSPDRTETATPATRTTVEDSDDDDEDNEQNETQTPFSPTQSDSGENTCTSEDFDLLDTRKEKPKHKWFVVPEVLNRQQGYSAKMQSSVLFQRRCYGSLHSVQRLELMYKLEEHDGCVNSLNFHPNGSLLASGSDDLKVVIWDWKLGKCLLKYDTKHRGNVFQSKFLNLSGDLHIATCARDGQVRLAQVSTEEGLRDNRRLGSHKGPCHKLAVLADQPHLLLSAGEDGVVLSHDVRRNRPDKIVVVKDEEREVALYSIHAHPLRTHEFCVSGRDHIVRVYDQRKSNEPQSTYHPFKKNCVSDYQLRHALHVTCAVYNHNGSEILASYNGDDIYLFDVNEPPGNYIHKYEGHRNGATIKGVNFFGPKSEYIVSGSDCGNVYFWDKNTESVVQWMLGDDNGVVNCLEPHPQLPFICTSGLDWDVKVWVPSCEHEPEMKDLMDTIKMNRSRLRLSSSDINESQMLWMLWRHLRSSSRMRDRVSSSWGARETGIFDSSTSVENSSDSSTNAETESNDDDDDDYDIDGPTGCATS